MIRKDVIIAVLAIFCLTATLFMVKPTRSQSANEYSPWTDLNDDGKIDILDLVKIALAFGTEGDPVDKTALLIEVNATFANLQSRMDAMNSSLLELWDTVNGLNVTNVMPLIDSLNSTLIVLQSKVTMLETNLTIVDLFSKGLADKIDLLNASLVELGNRVSVLEAQVTIMNSAIIQLEILYDNLNASLTSQQSMIDILNSTLTSRLNDLENKVNKLENSTILWNSTSISFDETTETTKWTDVVGLSVNINVNRTCYLLVMFSTDAYNYLDEYDSAQIYMQAVIDTQTAFPSWLMINPIVDLTGWDWLPTHSHQLQYGTYSFNFQPKLVSAGNHNVKMQWRVSDGTGYLYLSTLTVIALPAK